MLPKTRANWDMIRVNSLLSENDGSQSKHLFFIPYLRQVSFRCTKRGKEKEKKVRQIVHTISEHLYYG